MIQIGVDFGGTKIEAAALDAHGRVLARERVPNPGGYDRALTDVRDLVLRVEASAGAGEGSIGVGAPGSANPRTGLMRNANSTYLNGRSFRQDLERTIGRPIRLENDANCLALSEAVDGAAAGATVAFAVIVGTGCGGGVVVGGRTIEGANGVAGEWGHVPLPWMTADEHPGIECWCGQRGCLERYVSGSGFERDYAEATGGPLAAQTIIQAAHRGEAEAVAALDRYVDRLGRALAMVVNILDPDAFVFGGGMSNVADIYPRLPDVVRRYAFSDEWDARLAPAKWGDSSGVRGAARLWPSGG